MSFWARTESSARDQANAWFATAAATSFGCDFTITDLSQEAQ